MPLEHCPSKRKNRGNRYFTVITWYWYHKIKGLKIARNTGSVKNQMNLALKAPILKKILIS